jgi:hypothetical protein
VRPPQRPISVLRTSREEDHSAPPPSDPLAVLSPHRRRSGLRLLCVLDSVAIDVPDVPQPCRGNSPPPFRLPLRAADDLAGGASAPAQAQGSQRALSQQPAPSSCPRLPRTACSASRTLPPSFFKLQDLRPRRRCGERPRVILLPLPLLPSREGEDLGASAGGRTPPVQKLSAPMADHAECQELAPPRPSCNAPTWDAIRAGSGG